jgi:two-component system, response regulator YesN
LEKILPWDEMDIEVVGCAKNGEEAYGMIMNSQIDLVITDIKMPKMDGFALMDKLSEQLNPTPKYMVISGYDDFHYAKNAIQQGVMDYILKPIDPKELKASVLKTIEKLKMEKAERDNLWKLRMKDYVYERINHQTDEVNDGLFPEHCNYCLFFSTHSMYQELTEKSGFKDLICFSLHLGAYYLYVVIARSEELAEPRWINAVEEIRRHHTIGISKIRTHKDHSFYEALKETEMDYLLHDKHRISPRSDMLQDITLSTKDEIYFLEVLQARDKVQVLQKVKQIVNTYAYFEQQWVVHFQLYLFFSKYLSNSGSGLTEQVLWLHELKNIKTSKELELWQMKALEPTIDKIITIGQRSAPNYYLQAIKYIEEHYRNASLSLEAVARHLNLSTPYLSHIFNNRGENYTSYVTKKRIEKAKELLLNSVLTISEISESVGFNDVKYFNHVFKKETLCTPNHYRKLEK